MTMYYEFNTSDGIKYCIYNNDGEYPMKEYKTNEPCYVYNQYGEEYLMYPENNTKYIIGKYDESISYNYRRLTEEEFYEKVGKNKKMK